jgi:hypothetical protein
MDAKLVCQTAGVALRERLSIHGGDYSDPSSRTTIRMVTAVRVSLRVCQNLFGKFYVLPTSKKLCKVKKEFISNSLT